MSLSLYIDAGKIVDKILLKRCGLKDALFSGKADDGKLPKLKALVCKTLEIAPTVCPILDGGQSRSKRTPGSHLCLLHDILLQSVTGVKTFRGGGKIVKEVKRHAAVVRERLGSEELEKLFKTAQQKGGAHGQEDDNNHVPDSVFSYFRVNPRCVFDAGSERQEADEKTFLNKFLSVVSKHITADADENGGSGSKDLTGALLPLLDAWSLQTARKILAEHGGEEARSPEKVSPKTKTGFVWRKDPIVPMCYRLPTKDVPKILERVTSGDLIIQDRSSQFSALAALVDEEVVLRTLFTVKPCNEDCALTVMDACSAPGSKTTHLVHLLHYLLEARKKVMEALPGMLGTARQSIKVCVIAVEMDSARYKTLVTRMKQLCGRGHGSNLNLSDKARDGAVHDNQIDASYKFEIRSPAVEFLDDPSGCLGRYRIGVCVRNSDFLKLEDAGGPLVNVLVLDPSCSGSGLKEHGNLIVENGKETKDYTVPPPEQKKRVQKLASFQERMLRHALSKKQKMFSELKSCCYSTCSVFERENENVVQNVLAHASDEWSVTYPLPFEWREKGKLAKSKSLQSLCVHSLPWEHECRGFFIAKLKYGQGSSELSNSVTHPVKNQEGFTPGYYSSKVDPQPDARLVKKRKLRSATRGVGLRSAAKAEQSAATAESMKKCKLKRPHGHKDTKARVAQSAARAKPLKKRKLRRRDGNEATKGAEMSKTEGVWASENKPPIKIKLYAPTKKRRK